MSTTLATMPAPALGMYLRVLREARGLSQTDVARYVGVSAQAQISKWEHGTAVPSGDKLMAVVAVLQANPTYAQRLLLAEDLTPDDGRRIAEAQLILERYSL